MLFLIHPPFPAHSPISILSPDPEMTNTNPSPIRSKYLVHSSSIVPETILFLSSMKLCTCHHSPMHLTMYNSDIYLRISNMYLCLSLLYNGTMHTFCASPCLGAYIYQPTRQYQRLPIFWETFIESHPLLPFCYNKSYPRLSQPSLFLPWHWTWLVPHAISTQTNHVNLPVI